LEILHGLVLGAVVRRDKDGWYAGTVQINADEVFRLLGAEFVAAKTEDGICQLRPTERGMEILREAIQAAQRETFAWLRNSRNRHLFRD
jgi:hypothetical protein